MKNNAPLSSVSLSILSALFPLLFLFSQNSARVPFAETLLPSLILIISAAGIWATAKFISKSDQKAGLCVSIFFLFLFSYGYLYNAARSLDPDNLEIGRQRYLLVIYAGIFLATAHSLCRLRFQALQSAYIAFFILIISLTGISTLKIVIDRIQDTHPRSSLLRDNQNTVSQAAATADTPPDIYYIILDGYARADILKELYGHDNTPFLSFLAEKGFFVADQSNSNYSQTCTSLASSLNFTYLDDLADRVGAASRNVKPLERLIKDNETMRFLGKKGYTSVSFSSGWYVTELRNADIYKSRGFSLSEFQNALINMTPLPVLLEKLLSRELQYDLQRERLLYAFDHLPDRSGITTPVFVFAHIIAPHPPFVFGENGEAIRSGKNFSFDDGSLFMKTGDRKEYVENYRKQLIFVNSKIRTVIDKILSNPSRRSIIILQGDHGPGSMLDWDYADKTNLNERMAILNAYYFPDRRYDLLHANISPVNTFRVILDQYFGANYGLLEDKSYFSGWKKPYDLKPVSKH